MIFDVEIDSDNDRLCVTLTGFASLEDVKQFARDFSQSQHQLLRNRETYQLLYDVSQALIQSQEVVRALRELVLATPKVSAFALVNTSALAGRQINRIFAGVEVHACNSRTSAEAWLAAPVLIDKTSSS